jgi:hypothetical protein
MGGRNVVYAGEGPTIATPGGVPTADPNTIKIYDAAFRSPRELLETLLEETHHSKLMGMRPATRLESFNENWESLVEPRAKGFAALDAQRRIERYGELRFGDPE